MCIVKSSAVSATDSVLEKASALSNLVLRESLEKNKQLMSHLLKRKDS
jgi:hypothetical protein